MRLVRWYPWLGLRLFRRTALVRRSASKTGTVGVDETGVLRTLVERDTRDRGGDRHRLSGIDEVMGCAATGFSCHTMMLKRSPHGHRCLYLLLSMS